MRKHESITSDCNNLEILAGENAAKKFDRQLHTLVGRLTGGLSPLALGSAYFDWWVHLASTPFKLGELAGKTLEGAAKVGEAAMPISMERQSTSAVSSDKRFLDDRWRHYPYRFYVSAFLEANDWWESATTNIRGVSKRNERIISFMTRQSLDMMSPSNFPATNPLVQQRTLDENGQNLIRGLRLFQEDLSHLLGTSRREMGEFHVGKNLATTPGKVVYRNDLIELIHYKPTTEHVRSEPILIIPAWIMKYYILDLSEQNSLVKYLVDQGHSVFIVSWKNPDADEAGLSMEDYRRLGPEAALDFVSEQLPETKVHMAGYCLGGTLLAIQAAHLARKQDKRIASLTLFAAQVDFLDAGELTLFINESQLAFLEDIMAEQGYLRAEQMAGAFQMLRSNDLIWSRVIRHYLLGERTSMNALMAWNADSTRMPARMHSEYLRKLFLNNELSQRRYNVDGGTIALSDIRLPIFVVGTEKDHVSPWRSVYKINELTDTDVTCVLTNRGHNAGIVSEPGHKGRHYRIATKREGDLYRSPDEWFQQNSPIDGSWWPAWNEWLSEHSEDKQVDAVPRSEMFFKNALCPAPGEYVLQQ